MARFPDSSLTSVTQPTIASCVAATSCTESTRSAATTVYPSVARRRAVAAPMPDPAPVTMAVLPFPRLAIAGRYRSPMRGHRAASALLLVTLATAGLAVADVDDSAPAVAAPASDDRGTATTVELLKPGLQPRAPLRITAPAGSAVTSTVTQDLLLLQRVLGKLQTPTNVTVSTDLQMTVTAVDAQGRRTVSFTYSNSTVPALNGVTGTVAISDRGVATSGSFEFPPGTDATTQQVLGQYEDQFASLSTPFPEEAVGNGARWKVTQHPEVNGLRMTQSIVYTLLQRKGSVLTLESTTHQTAARQPLKSPNLPAGTTATVVKSEGE